MTPSEKISDAIAALADGLNELLAQSWTSETVKDVERLLHEYSDGKLDKLMRRLEGIERRLDKLEDEK